MSKRCENCRYWDSEDVEKGRRVCLKDIFDSFDGLIPDDAPMVTNDGICYMAVLRTLPTHYCSPWEPKQSKPKGLATPK